MRCGILVFLDIGVHHVAPHADLEVTFIIHYQSNDAND